MNDTMILSVLFALILPVGIFLSILVFGGVYQGAAVFLVAALTLFMYMDNYTGVGVDNAP